ncbi:MAG: hypothetical protein PHQ23_16710 [Candidatus Wallbacteria bacterium]|nr:hypothetical protein [Candidatus Wallbacteria bacterium]
MGKASATHMAQNDGEGLDVMHGERDMESKKPKGSDPRGSMGREKQQAWMNPEQL